DQREACVFGTVEAAVVVPVELVELRAQSRGDAALDHALPALLELGTADHAVVVRVPGLEGLVHAARRRLRLRLCLGPCPGGQQQARDGGEQDVHCGAAACPAGGISDSNVMRSRISGVRRPIIIGLRTFGRKLMSKISVMSPSKRIQLSTSPLTSDTICTPHQGSASRLRSSSSSCRPWTRWSRGLDRPTGATSPAIDRPRAKPGTNASGTNACSSKATQPR